MLKSISRALGATSILLAAGASMAQGAFPDRPLTVIVPFPAGGAADTVARWMLPPFTADLKQSAIVENQPGASGSIATAKVLAQPADGLRLILCTSGETVTAPLALAAARYNADDLRLVGQLSQTRLVLAARPNLPAKTMADLIAAMRANGSRDMTYGSFGPGSSAHMAMEDLKQRLGVGATHIPYKGMAPAMQDLMGNQVDLGFLILTGGVLDLVQSGKLTALMVTGTGRHPRLPDVPSAGEIKEVQGFDYMVWAGVCAPRKTPEPIVARLGAALNAVLANPEYRKSTEGAGAIAPSPHTPGQADAIYLDDVAKARKVAAAIRLEPQ